MVQYLELDEIMVKLCGNRTFDVLSPTFEKENPDYKPDYDYVGSDFLYQKLGIALPNAICGVNFNRCAFVHDYRFSNGTTTTDFNAANKEFKDNIQKTFSAGGHPYIGFLVSHIDYWGVSSLVAYLDFRFCKKGT